MKIPFLGSYSHPFYPSYFDVNYRATIGFDTLSFDFMGADLSDKFLGISMGISMGSYPRVNGTRCGKAMGKDTRKMNYK